MADYVNHSETIFHVTDLATKPLKAIAAAGHGVSHAFDHASSLVGMFGSAAAIAGGAFSAHEIITDSMKYLGTVKRIGDVTGMVAEKADAFLGVMKGVGIPAEDAERSLMQMTRQGQRMEMSMMGVSGATHGVATLFARMGIDMRGGPVAAFNRMAVLAKKNKLGITDISIAFRLPIEQARKMMSALKEGPGAIAKLQKELKERGLGVTAEDIASYARIQKVTNQIKELWERIVVVIGKTFLPIIEPLLDHVRNNLEGWAQHAAQFTKNLGRFIKEHGPAIVRIAKLMAMNFMLMKTTGMGMGGWIGKLAPLLGKMGGLGKIQLLAPRMNVGRSLGHGLGDAKAFLQLLPDYAKMFMGKIGSMLSGVGKVFTMPIGKVFATIVNALFRLRPLVTALLKLTLVGALIGFVIGAIVEAVTLIKNNVDGIRTFLGEWWDTIKARVSVIYDLLEPITSWFSESGVVGEFFHKFIFVGIMAASDAVDGMLQVLQTIILVIKEIGTDFKKVMMSPLETFRQSWDKAGELTVKKQRQQLDDQVKQAVADRQAQTKTPDNRAKPPLFDFRGSRFDIEQKFAEGFDPDRIAVAFSNDLAMLGERKLQSGFSPLYAVR